MLAEAKPIEVRAGMDNDFFYIGYSRFPGNKALARSVLNKVHYKPSPIKPYDNTDGSVTLRFLRDNFTLLESLSRANLSPAVIARLNRQERHRNFSDFVGERVVPQLAEAIKAEVVAPAEIQKVELIAGRMSLFAADVVLGGEAIKIV